MKSMSQSRQLDMDMIFSIMTEEKGKPERNLENQHKQTEKILSEGHNAEADGGKLSSDFWNVSCRENGAGTAANLLFSGVNEEFGTEERQNFKENEVRNERNPV